MSLTLLPHRCFLVFLLVAIPGGLAQPPGGKTLPDLAEFKTVETAVTTRVSKAGPAAAALPGYLGVHVIPQAQGKLRIAHVEAESPAARAGLQAGDVLLKVGDQAVASPEDLRGALQARTPGENVKLAIVRQEKNLEVPAILAATSRALTLGTRRAVLGVQIGEAPDGEGIAVKAVSPNSPAAAAGMKTGDVLLKLDGTPLTGPSSLNDTLFTKKPGDTVLLTLKRDGKQQALKVKLGADQGGFGKQPGSWDNRLLSIWKKDAYRLAVVCVEYPDVKHNPKIACKNWQDALFSRNTYKGASVTGKKVYGSLSDYYQEQSFGALKVAGKVFDFIQVGKKRAEYSQGTGVSGKSALLVEAVNKLLARDGKDALKNFDGIFFLYAGERFQTNRGGLYWPHRASFTHQGKRWPYFICPEGGARMNNISVTCHEFGHMLGLPDLYARPEQPGSEGVGAWCAMSNQIGNGRPQHFSAWSKEQLGWIQPAVLDPTVKQKLILAPVEDSPKECFKVLVKLDGSEYFLLENRKKKGFDSDLPGEGLLIWRVVQNKPILEESHGVEGPAGPRVFLGSVPYPSPSNNAFTPYTQPSSRGQLGGGLPVFLTNIRRLPDGRITFFIGYEYL